MKKKIVLILATLMCVSLCACGGAESTSGNNTDTKKEESGFTPNQVTEQEETEETTTAPNNMTVEEMQKYYDVTEFVGTPYLTVCEVSGGEKGTNTMNLIGWTEIYGVDIEGHQTTSVIFTIEKTDSLEYWKKYNVIACDNNTTDDTSDDVIAYIFTTPVE